MELPALETIGAAGLLGPKTVDEPAGKGLLDDDGNIGPLKTEATGCDAANILVGALDDPEGVAKFDFDSLVLLLNADVEAATPNAVEDPNAFGVD